MRLLITTLLLTLTSTIPSSAGDVLTPEQVTELEDLVNALMVCQDIPGLSVAVVRGNETWTRGFGLADKASRRKVDSATRFAIGSISKSIAAALASQFLSESEGRTWQTPLVNILGEDLKLWTDDLTRQVTLKDVLSHRTGLASSFIPMMAGMPVTLTSQRLTQRLRFLKAELPFRDEMLYNNWMYGLAGRVTEVMGGAPWEELLQTRLFQPLGMTDSGIIGQTVTLEADNVAQPYVQVGKEVVPADPSVYSFSPLAPLNAAGAIASSADDMAKWLRMLINKGKTPEGVHVLDEQRMREMHKVIVPMYDSPLFMDVIHKPLFPVSFAYVGYGLGWFSSEYRGYRVKWHAGGFFAYASNLFYLTDVDAGLYVASNGPGGAGSFITSQVLSFFIADLLLNEQPWLNASTACHFPKPWLELPSMDRPDPVVAGEVDDPDAFVGTYGNGLFGDVEVVNSKDQGLTLSHNRLVGKLRKTAVNNVLLLEVQGPLRFLSALKDRVIYINTTFSQPAQDTGKYGELLFSFPDFGFPETASYKRGVRYEDGIHDEL